MHTRAGLRRTRHVGAAAMPMDKERASDLPADHALNRRTSPAATSPPTRPLPSHTPHSSTNLPSPDHQAGPHRDRQLMRYTLTPPLETRVLTSEVALGSAANLSWAGATICQQLVPLDASRPNWDLTRSGHMVKESDGGREATCGPWHQRDPSHRAEQPWSGCGRCGRKPWSAWWSGRGRPRPWPLDGRSQWLPGGCFSFAYAGAVLAVDAHVIPHAEVHVIPQLLTRADDEAARVSPTRAR